VLLAQAESQLVPSNMQAKGCQLYGIIVTAKSCQLMIGRGSATEAVLFGGADREEFGWQATVPLGLHVDCD